jgi:RNA:NAD 2'-phosphotransferase (TPT1/KptA family)
MATTSTHPPRGRGRGGHSGEGDLVQLSKKLSYLLRHGAVKEGLTISPDGFVSMEDMISHTKYILYPSFVLRFSTIPSIVLPKVHNYCILLFNTLLSLYC